MKRILIVLVAFVCIVGVCIYCRTLVKSINTEISDCLQKIEVAANKTDKERCMLLADELVSRANEAGKKLGRFYSHVYGEELKNNCRLLKYHIAEERWTELDGVISECRYALQMILAQEAVKWENIL